MWINVIVDSWWNRFSSLHKSLTNETILLSQHTMLIICYVSLDLFSVLSYSSGPVVGCCVDPANRSLQKFSLRMKKHSLFQHALWRGGLLLRSEHLRRWTGSYTADNVGRTVEVLRIKSWVQFLRVAKLLKSVFSVRQRASVHSRRYTSNFST